MEFKILSYTEGRKPGEMKIIPIYKDAEALLTVEENNILKGLIDKKIFKGEKGTSYTSVIKEDMVYKKVTFVGLGEKDNHVLFDYKLAIGTGIKKAKRNKCSSVEIILSSALCKEEFVLAATEAAVLADYDFNKYKTAKEDQGIRLEVTKLVLEETVEEAAEIVQKGLVIGEGTNYARDLVNEPANKQSPEDLAGEAFRIGQDYPEIDVEIFREQKIEALGMEAFLAVAGSAKNPPRFIVLKYRGDADSDEVSLGIAGKGIVYDTGGLSLKPSEHMKTMKTDMGGAASTIAVMEAIARMRLKVNVTAVVAACENAIGGGNYRPGDIISSMSGKSIYIANTDAEGRLTLADAVYYLSSVEKANKIVDIATLTGAAEVALGQRVIASVTNDDEFFGLIEEASALGQEKIWKLPNFEEYKELFKATDADLANSGGRYAGAITAGLFVGEFIGDEPWVHLDIAGPSYTEKPNSLEVKGATGSGLSILYYLIQQLESE